MKSSEESLQGSAKKKRKEVFALIDIVEQLIVFLMADAKDTEGLDDLYNEVRALQHRNASK